MQVPDLLPPAIGAVAGSADGLAVHLDEKRGSGQRYQTIFRLLVLGLGAGVEFMGGNPRVSEALLVTGTSLLGSEVAVDLAGRT